MKFFFCCCCCCRSFVIRFVHSHSAIGGAVHKGYFMCFQICRPGQFSPILLVVYSRASPLMYINNMYIIKPSTCIIYKTIVTHHLRGDFSSVILLRLLPLFLLLLYFFFLCFGSVVVGGRCKIRSYLRKE